MKLLTKYNRINLIPTVVIFLLACTAFSLLLRYVLINQVDEDLTIEQNEITSYVEKYNRLPEIIKVWDQQIIYTPVEKKITNTDRKFHTSTAYNQHEREDETIRELNFSIQAGGQWYSVAVSKSLEGTDNLIQSIIIITIVTIALMLLATLLLNRFVLRRLWQPFYNTLETVGSFKLGNSKNLSFPETGIDEFTVMNKTLHQAISKADSDYVLLKEFTENASHELQTPLAVIRSKLDLLIQDEHLSNNQSGLVQSAYEAIQRLSRLNKSMLLLAKIENRQFTESAEIDTKFLIESKLNQFKELWQNKNIEVTAQLQPALITINSSLADVLLNNLISNAVKHNKEGGTININLAQGLLNISNTGSLQPLIEKSLFTRFHKDIAANENNGLGLSIVKQICDASGCTVSYHFDDKQLHTFLLRW